MSVLIALGVSLALLAADRPIESSPRSDQSTAAGPRIRKAVGGPSEIAVIRPIGLATATPGLAPPKPACIGWYYPAPADFSKASTVTETFWIAGNSTVLSSYAGHEAWIGLSDSVTGASWTVNSATWEGTWLKIEATHSTVTPIVAAPSKQLPAPQAPSKRPPIPGPMIVETPAPAPSAPVGGTLTISLDPAGGANCADVWFPCTYY